MIMQTNIRLEIVILIHNTIRWLKSQWRYMVMWIIIHRFGSKMNKLYGSKKAVRAINLFYYFKVTSQKHKIKMQLLELAQEVANNTGSTLSEIQDLMERLGYKV